MVRNGVLMACTGTEADMDQLDTGAWVERCAHRITQLDPELAFYEAKELADDLRAFERTRAMDPEAAADFVADQLARPDRPRFERRLVSR
jgi:hypothetical protein